MGDLTALVDLVRGVAAFLVVVPVLVAVHELGHFWAARACGMKVDAFAVMVGGRRATDLSGRLERPLGSAAPLWALGIVGALVALLGPAGWSLAGLALAGIAAPWAVGHRLERLYHLPRGTALRTFGWAAAAGAGVLLFASGLRAGAASWVGVLSAAAWAAVLVLYYRPVLGKAEDSPQGEGRIFVGDEVVPVSFRPLLARKDRHGTEFSLLALPIGGFAAIRGMHPKEDGAETRVEGGFYSRPPWQRWIVLFAGPFFSIAFGVAVLTGVFATAGRTVPDEEPVLGTVAAGGPAEAAGLRSGDRIVSIGGAPVERFYDIVRNVRDRTGPGSAPVEVVFERGGERMTASVVPKVDETPSPVLGPDLELTDKTAVQAKLLVGPRPLHKRVPLDEAFVLAVRQPFDMAAGLVSLAAKPQRATEDLGGPATIATQTAEASKQGLYGLLVFGAFLSISFGVFNLLPVSPLDGGQMLVAMVEMLRGGRRLSFRTQSVVANVSFVLLGLLVLTVLTADVRRLAGRPGAPEARQER